MCLGGSQPQQALSCHGIWKAAGHSRRSPAQCQGGSQPQQALPRHHLDGVTAASVVVLLHQRVPVRRSGEETWAVR